MIFWTKCSLLSSFEKFTFQWIKNKIILFKDWFNVHSLHNPKSVYCLCVVILLPTHHLFNYLNLIPASFFSGEEGRGGGNLQIFEGKLCKKYCKWCNWWRTWIEHRMPSYWATFYQGPLFLNLPKVLKISSSRSFHLMVFLLGNACIHLLPICDHHKHDVVHQTKLPASGWFTVV